MRPSQWFTRWRNNDHAERNEGRHEARRSTSTRGSLPELWRRWASERRRRGSMESPAKCEIGPLSHGLF